MRLLVIFDSLIDKDYIARICKQGNTKEVDLLPLGDSLQIPTDVDRALRQRFNSINTLDSIKIIGEQIEELQEKICKWSANIANNKTGGKSTKEWFILPGYRVSAWWFSLLSEKNTIKTDIFLRVAQVNAAKKVLHSGIYSYCAIVISHKNLRDAIRQITRRLSIPETVFPVYPKGNKKNRIKNFFEYHLGIFGQVILGIRYGVKFFMRGIYARRYISRYSKRMPDSPSLLFVTYYPAVEKDPAQKGIFRNKYASILQDKLNELGVKVTWLAMYVPQLNGYGFCDALRLTGNFIEKGENLFMLEEFFTFRNFIISISLWLRQAIRSCILFRLIDKKVLLSDPIGEENRSFIQQLWSVSFCHAKGLDAIMHYLIFREVFKQIPGIKDCLYYCEMQAWEKALNAARRSTDTDIRTIAFQHTSFSRNYFHYFYDRSELEGNAEITDLPLPDILACNGEFAYSRFIEAGYQNVVKVEAIRNLYLDRKLSGQDSCQPIERNILLVAGTIERKETRNLILMVKAAFPKAEKFAIWFKGHPALPVEEIFKELNIDAQSSGYLICKEEISDCLKCARAVIVTTSTVAIEALAFGCEVIIPDFPDLMLMSPLADFRGYYHRVISPQELATKTDSIFNGECLHDIEEYHRFVRRYWFLDSALPKWREFLLRGK